MKGPPGRADLLLIGTVPVEVGGIRSDQSLLWKAGWMTSSAAVRGVPFVLFGSCVAEEGVVAVEESVILARVWVGGGVVN